MDKKRRENTVPKSDVNARFYECTLPSVLQLVSKSDKCGIHSKKFNFLKEFGDGFFEYHKFNGLYVGVFDVNLKKNITAYGKHEIEVLELSFLLEGEQIIKKNNYSKDLIYESQESYMVYLAETAGKITYNNQKHLKEVKIRMEKSFVKRHRLDEEYDLFKKYTLENIDVNFGIPLCAKKQEIITQILSNTDSGLLKRLFLESKILELIVLQLNSKKEVRLQSNDNLVKKLYQVQFIISADLSIQHSIPQLAKQVGLNDFTLKKEFKRIFKETVFEYATNSRMQKAKKLLKNSPLPIYEISELVGYKNSTHFTAAFKKKEATTPNKYRKEKN